jgi:hypothetical protein
MTSTRGTHHLGSGHRNTLSRILERPINSNIEWRAVLSLLDAAAVVEQSHVREYRVTLGHETEVFRPPHGKDVDAQTIVDLSRMFRAAGYGTETSASMSGPMRDEFC